MESFTLNTAITHLKYVLFVFVILITSNQTAYAEEKHQSVQVADPYIEMHTGPGRGFPIFHVVDRYEWVEIIKRKTDWFKVRTDQNKTGWVPRSQMERTLTQAGTKKRFRDVLVNDYLRRRFEFGVSGGDFESDPFVTARLGYKISQNILIELAYGEVAGDFSSSDIYSINLVSTPFPKWRVSPNFTIGYGRFENTPRATLVNAEDTDSDLANAGIGARFYLTERFFIRADYRYHIVLSNDDETDDFDEITGGIGFFF
ncbi:MAG: outer membrane beta-barrel protein [Gammaproteobacteria bacterium]